MIPFATALIGNYPYNSLASCIYVSTIFLWTLTFQFLDISITNSNPGAPLDEMRENKNRLIIFGGYVIAFVIALSIPLLSIIIMGISTLIMALKILWAKKRK